MLLCETSHFLLNINNDIKNIDLLTTYCSTKLHKMVYFKRMEVSCFKPCFFSFTPIMQNTALRVGQTGTLVSERIINMFNATTVTYRY